jgi:hypothetical protein
MRKRKENVKQMIDKIDRALSRDKELEKAAKK